MDTLVSMRVFRKVVELESFVAAAARMEMSAAMTSKHVMHLERHLGGRLLNRTSRHLSLTEIGKVYFEQCCEMLDSLDEAEASVSRAAIVPSGVLKISAPVWFANRKFTKVLANYHSRFAAVTLDIDLSGRIVNLVEEGFDLALRVTQSPGSNLIAHPIASIQFYMVGSPSYFQKAGYPLKPKDLSQHAMITYSLLSEGELAVEGLTGKESVKIKSSLLRTNNENLIHDAAMDGMGLAFLPTWLIEDDIASGHLERVMPDYRFPSPMLYAVYTSRKYLSSKVRTFVDFIAESGQLK
ncbi:LysR family transcriptional regulator [Nostoc sp. NMS4]|uniref:LysR family transcriptional regulator n=1 Tax=Nostoc sp. NMS4 TaxID=2815390 RepID=UPI0025DF183E|nr:LysR family transcriptional regulator [Nostoc sp. NMS4]MBN3925986.1 LysR family transcriptional regulator [Nostoc sp. NMS4]